MRSRLRIEDYMTPRPHTIHADFTVAKAAELMSREGIRHLPVVREGALVGIISERDIRSCGAFRGPGQLRVGEVMMPEPFIAHPGAPVDLVAEIMAARRHSCAIVTGREGEILGVFTDSDALRLLARKLREAD